MDSIHSEPSESLAFRGPHESLTADRSAVSRRGLVVGGVGLTLICLFLFFWRLGAVPLFDLDEGIYATCARQMVLTGDWITPRLNSRPPVNPAAVTVPFFEKPILIYWLAAASMKGFGISPWAARLPVALAALFTTLLVVVAGVRWFGPRAGLLAGLVYATAPISLADARQLTTDGLLVLWFTMALLAFAAVAGATAGSARGAYSGRGATLLFWLSCALAVLTKGAVGLLLPLLVIGMTLTLDRFALHVSWRRPKGPKLRFLLRLSPVSRLQQVVRSLHPLAGLLLVAALTTPWHLLIWRAGGRDALGHTWVQEYLIRQHIGRFKGLDTVHNAPLPTYLVFFLIGFFPWACFVPAAFRLPWNRNKLAQAAAGVFSPHHFLLVWFWTIFIFFSIAAAKLPTYIAPAYPAAALLVGRWLDSAFDQLTDAASRSLRRGAGTAFATAMLLVAAALLGPRFAPARAPIPSDVQRLALHLTGLLAFGCGAAWICFSSAGPATHRRQQMGVCALAAMLLLAIGIGGTEGYAVAARDILDPYQQVAAAASPDAMRGVPVIYYDIIPRRPSMNYYADYSPLERKEEPLMPFLNRVVPAKWRQVDVVTSRDVYNRQLRAELADHPEIACSLIAARGGNRSGWVLVALRPIANLKEK